MTDLSPAAQAVMDAVRALPIPLNDHQERVCIAAALRAAADQPYEVPWDIRGEDYLNYRQGVAAERERILTIVAELEGTND